MSASGGPMVKGLATWITTHDCCYYPLSPHQTKCEQNCICHRPGDYYQVKHIEKV